MNQMIKSFVLIVVSLMMFGCSARVNGSATAKAPQASPAAPQASPAAPVQTDETRLARRPVAPPNPGFGLGPMPGMGLPGPFGQFGQPGFATAPSCVDAHGRGVNRNLWVEIDMSEYRDLAVLTIEGEVFPCNPQKVQFIQLPGSASYKFVMSQEMVNDTTFIVTRRNECILNPRAHGCSGQPIIILEGFQDYGGVAQSLGRHTITRDDNIEIPLPVKDMHNRFIVQPHHFRRH
jgi:hypothetical protein